MFIRGDVFLVSVTKLTLYKFALVESVNSLGGGDLTMNTHENLGNMNDSTVVVFAHKENRKPRHSFFHE